MGRAGASEGKALVPTRCPLAGLCLSYHGQWLGLIHLVVFLFFFAFFATLFLKMLHKEDDVYVLSCTVQFDTSHAAKYQLVC